MYDLTNEEKLKFIIKKSKELGITPNDYGENTKISTMGAYNILTGESKNPRTKNLNIMLQYLESKVVGKEYQPEQSLRIVAEPRETNEDDIETIIYKRVSKRFERKLNDIEKRLIKLEAKI